MSLLVYFFTQSGYRTHAALIGAIAPDINTTLSQLEIETRVFNNPGTGEKGHFAKPETQV